MSFDSQELFGFLARLLAVGIFLVENVNHCFDFSKEVHEMVHPAIAPLPISLAYGVHFTTICLGLVGSSLFLSAKVGSKQFLSSVIALSVFMMLITWNWWIRRFGQFVWDIEDPRERKMRTIHCLKNLSIFGFLLTVGQIGSTVSQKGKDKTK